MEFYMFGILVVLVLAAILIFWIVLTFFYSVPRELHRVANSLESICIALNDIESKIDNRKVNDSEKEEQP